MKVKEVKNNIPGLGRVVYAAVLLAATIPFSSALAQEETDSSWSVNLSGFLGRIDLDEADWGNRDIHGSIGLISDWKKQDWPVSIALDLIGSGREDKSSATREESTAATMHIGVRKVFGSPDQDFRPYIGGGLMLVESYWLSKELATGIKTREEDSGTGTWVGIGAYKNISTSWQMGFDLRYSQADVELLGERRKAGGLQTAFSLGYQW